MRKGSCQDPFHGRELRISCLTQSHVVKLGAHWKRDFSPEVAPVHISLVALFLKLGPLFQGKGKNVAVRLLPDNSNVPL